MAKVLYTGDTAEKYISPSYIVVQKYESDDEWDSPSGDSYILEDVVRGTTTGSQEDNDETDIECETSDSPIYTSVKKGAFKVEAEVADTQDDLLIGLCDFIEGSDGKLYARSKYIQMYVKFAIVYELSDGSLVGKVFPKLLLHTQQILEDLNENIDRIKLNGTAHDISITVDDKTYRTPFYKETGYELPTETETTE